MHSPFYVDATTTTTIYTRECYIPLFNALNESSRRSGALTEKCVDCIG
jgi:hypothetical protein